MSSFPPRFGSIHLRLRLLQPEPHVHLAVHRGCGGEVLLRLLALTRAPVELAEAGMTVGHERAHLELGCQGHCGAVVRRGGRHVEASTMRGDVASRRSRTHASVTRSPRPRASIRARSAQERASSTWLASRYASPSRATLSERYAPIPARSWAVTACCREARPSSMRPD